MKKIYVLDEEGQLQKIDAGVELYKELTDAPIIVSYNGVSLIDSKVLYDKETTQLSLIPEEGHKWTKEEILTWCQHANTGKYDIISEDYGTELLMVDATNENLGRRYRRITVDQDVIYDTTAEEWIPISDTSAKALVFKIQNESLIPKILVVGNQLVLECYYYSTVGPGAIKITKNGKTIVATSLTSGKTTNIILTNEVTDGVNEFRYEVTNNGVGNLEKIIVGSIGLTGIRLVFTPQFNYMTIKKGIVAYPFQYSGTGIKYVQFTIKNANGVESVYSPDNYFKDSGNSTINIPAEYFSHGENFISAFMYMRDGTSTNILTQTDTITYNFPYVQTEEPIIITYFDYDSLLEWDSVNIPYYIWATKNATSIKFELEYVQLDEKGEIINKVMCQTYDNSNESFINNYLTYNTEHKWQLSNIPHGTLEFRIYLNGESEPTFVKSNVKVKESSYNFKTIDGYLYNFAPTDITDTNSFEEWGSNDSVLELEGFNWTTDGIITDIDKSLRFAPAAQATMVDNYHLFSYVDSSTNGSGSGEEGLTLEFDFKVDETADNSKPIIKYVDNNNPRGKGIYIYPCKAVFNYNAVGSEDDALIVNYQKGERTNITICIEPKLTLGTNRYFKVFVNGILSLVTHYSATTEFAVDCNQFYFNVSNNEMDLYGFRAYNRCLDSNNILQNYISNFASTDTKIQKLLDNNLFSSTELTYTTTSGDVKTINGEYLADFDKAKDLIDVMVVISDALPESKAYIKCRTIFYEKDPNNPIAEWDSEHNRSKATTYYYNDEGELNKAIKFGGQGTSSMEYPRKNFKFKFNDKFYIKGHTTGKDKTFTFKADYMDSSGANNICNAQIMQNGLILDHWPNTPVQEGKRLTLDGFPVVTFWATAVDSDGIPYKTNTLGERIKPEYLGTFNFNYDKKAKALCGWEDPGYTFQGFEFRSNTGTICLQKGIPCMLGFENSNIGFEWRWTTLTDLVDDYHDGNLSNTMDGGFINEDINIFTPEEYVEARWSDEEPINLKPFNRFYIGEDQVFIQDDAGKYNPLNYISFNPIKLDVFGLEYGVKISNGNLLYQLPYGVKYNADGTISEAGKLYDDGSGYYKYSRNPQHEFKFEYNKDAEYFANDENWTILCSIDKVFKKHITYTASDDGAWVNDGDCYLPYSGYANYDANGDLSDSGEYIKLGNEEIILRSAAERYNQTIEYLPVTASDEITTYDLMKQIFNKWWYCVDTLSHCNDQNFKLLIDNTKSYSDDLGNNGKGLFIYSALLDYYCLSVVTGLCDNFCKNMFVHSYDDGNTWVPAWYDMDTCFGLNNTGKYAFDYDIDFKDSGVFNGSNSTLWDSIYRLCYNDLQSNYRVLRQSKISYDQVMNVLYGQNIKYKTEAMYNANAFFRYIIPDLSGMSGTQLPGAQGSRLQLLKYWNSNRQTFLDSVYGSDSYTSDKITMRMYAPKTFDFSLTTDTNMVVGLAFDASDASMPTFSSGKIEANTPWTYTYVLSSPTIDKNTYIFGASHLTDVGNLSYTMVKNINLAPATKIKRLILGTDDPDLLARQEEVIKEQGMEINMPAGVCKNMKEIDLHNLHYMKFDGSTALSLISINGAETINLMPALERLDIRNTNITIVAIGDYTPLKYIGFSNIMTVINLNNLLKLETIELDDISTIGKLLMKNCPKLNQLEILNKFYGKTMDITADNLQGTPETAVTTDYMTWLSQQNADLGGTVYVQGIDQSVLNPFRIKFPKLNIILEKVYEDEVIFGITGEGE